MAYVGGGSLPDQKLASWVVEIVASGLSDTDLASRLRLGEPAVMGRLRDGKLVLDVRTVFPQELESLAGCVRRATDPGEPPA